MRDAIKAILLTQLGESRQPFVDFPIAPPFVFHDIIEAETAMRPGFGEGNLTAIQKSHEILSREAEQIRGFQGRQEFLVRDERDAVTTQERWDYRTQDLEDRLW